MNLYLFLFVSTATVFVLTECGHFTVKTKEAASLIGGVEEVECDVTYNSSDSEGNNTTIPESYIVYWNFTAVGSQNQVTVLRLTKQGSEVSVDWSGNDKKYGQSAETNLKIHDVSVFDGGTYTCIVESGENTASSSSEVFVVESALCHDLKDKYVTGEMTNFTCLVGFHGNRPPNVYWTTGSTKMNATSLEINRNVVTATLRMKTTPDMDGRIYSCHIAYDGIFMTSCQTKSALVLNILYPVKNIDISLSPHVKAIIVSPNWKKYTYSIGLKIWFYCGAKGNPDPKVVWTFAAADGSGSIVKGTTHHFKIDNLQRSDEGNYTCTAYNVISGVKHNITKMISLTVKERDISYGGYQHVVSHNTDSKLTDDASKKDNKLNTGDINNTSLQKKKHNLSEFSPYAIGAIISAALAIVLIIVFIILAIKFKARDRRMRQQFSRIHDENLDDQEVELLDENIQPNMNSDPPRLKQFWEIPRKDVRMNEFISRGSYVEVWKGRMRKFPEKDEVIRIAIKKIADEATEKDRKFFLAEMEVLKMLKSHINVIQIIGCYTLNEPWLIMLEYAQEGTLFEYLQNGRPGDDQEVEITSNVRQSVKLKKKRLDSYRLLALAAQVANGLEHLNRFKLIYYRLRASSVLMAKGGICKLSGFGFSQDIRERNCYESNSSPIRWMSPESIKESVYNVKTDVWSYGITMWEILHFGTTPYPAMGPQEAEESILSGYIMPQPPHCSDKVYNIMTSCWDQNPENRPGYNTILQWLTGLASEHSNHVNLDKLNLGDNLSSSDLTTSPENISASTEKETVE